jgi:hypothetical protein
LSPRSAFLLLKEEESGAHQNLSIWDSLRVSFWVEVMLYKVRANTELVISVDLPCP